MLTIEEVQTYAVEALEAAGVTPVQASTQGLFFRDLERGETGVTVVYDYAKSSHTVYLVRALGVPGKQAYRAFRVRDSAAPDDVRRVTTEALAQLDAFQRQMEA